MPGKIFTAIVSKSEGLQIRLLFAFLLISLSGLIFIVIVFRFQLALAFNKFAASIAYESPSETTLALWRLSIQNPIISEYLNSNPETKSSKQDTLYKIYTKYDYRLSPVQPMVEELENSTLPIGFVFRVEGKLGYDVYTTISRSMQGPTVIKEKEESQSLSKSLEAVKTKVIKGTGNVENIQSDINALLQSFITAMEKAKNVSEFLIEEVDASAADFSTTNNLSVLEVEWQVSSGIIKDNPLLQLGKVKILLGNCNYYVKVPIFFDFNKNSYHLSNFDNVFNVPCPAGPSHAFIAEIATCADCTLAPVDKNYRLTASYYPLLTRLDVIGSSQSFLSAGASDLIEMVNAARSSGLGVEVTSAFRSYETQYNTFEYWTGIEMARWGISRQDAEVRANSYSAIPGFSEHQLGTAVDLTGIGCQAFVYCQSNANLWEWLRVYAHNYGFVQSYPAGKEGETGYITEAWHYRWIGKGLALEYKAQEGQLSLNNWLRAKGLY